MTDSAPSTEATQTAVTNTTDAAVQATQSQPTAHQANPPSAGSQPASQMAGNNGPGPVQQMLDALNGLPERIVNAMKEATPPPAQTTAPKAEAKTEDKTETKTTESSAGTQPPQKRKSFAEYWFSH